MEMYLPILPRLPPYHPQKDPGLDAVIISTSEPVRVLSALEVVTMLGCTKRCAAEGSRVRTSIYTPVPNTFLLDSVQFMGFFETYTPAWDVYIPTGHNRRSVAIFSLGGEVITSSMVT